ncbi:MAG: sulfatase [Planctomycetota bacterium]|nr:sulfatase [Planctomycetota bacterium]
MKLSANSWACLLLFGLATCLSSGCGGDQEDGAFLDEAILSEKGVGQPASVVLLLIDTLRVDHTNLAGYERSTTPFLEEIAGESIVFDRAYANASWTRASMATLFSSRLPESHGCENRDGTLSASVTTFTELLQGEGYETVGVVSNGNVVASLGFDQGFDTYTFIKDFPENLYADATVMKEPAVEAIEALGEGDAFLYLHYVDPHDPYRTREEFEYAPGNDSLFDGSRKALRFFRGKRPPPRELEKAVALYDGEIAWLDEQLREVFQVLEEQGVLDRAWVIVTSDHGEGLWQHRVHGHGQEVFEEQLRVPLLFRPPGGLRESVRIPEAFPLIDVAPTLMDLLGVAVPADFEGTSWTPYLMGKSAVPKRTIIVDEEMDAFNLGAIIDGEDKLIVDFNKQRAWLYDLEENPGELSEDAVEMGTRPSSTGRRLQEHLMRELKKARQRRPAAGADADTLLDEETKAHLEGLGYGGEVESDEGDHR